MNTVTGRHSIRMLEESSPLTGFPIDRYSHVLSKKEEIKCPQGFVT